VSRLSDFLANLALALLSAVVTLSVAEVLLRTVVPPSRGYFVNPPGADWTEVVHPGVFPGVVGVVHVRINQFGIRGRVFGDDRVEFRMLAVGGSTTRCGTVDDTLVWTHLVEAALGRTADGRTVWFGNVGRDGTTTRDHVLHLKYLLPQYSRIDVVVALVGANDMLWALQQGWSYHVPAPLSDPGVERARMVHAFYRVPGRWRDQIAPTRDVPWFKTTELWQLSRRARQALPRTFHIEARPEEGVEEARRAREAASLVDSLPPLDAALAEYRRNLNTMADLAAAAGAELVLVTQPSVWRAGMSPTEQPLLQFGDLGPARRAYFSPPALGRAMARFNETLLDVCRARGLDCVDAASVIPRDTTAMYDDIHFNANGSRLLASVVADYFRRRPPFHRPE